jgi:hypothetical protein
MTSKFYFVKSIEGYFKCTNKQEAIMQFFSLNKLDFLIYSNERMQLIVPKYFSFPTNIEKGLIIKTGLLPKEVQKIDLSISELRVYRDTEAKSRHIINVPNASHIPYALKGYSNISENNLKLLLSSVEQRSIITAKASH